MDAAILTEQPTPIRPLAISPSRLTHLQRLEAEPRALAAELVQVLDKLPHSAEGQLAMSRETAGVLEAAAAAGEGAEQAAIIVAQDGEFVGEK